LQDAQEKITGVITTVDGSPLSGATITIKGNNSIASADSSGIFAIGAKQNDVLVVSLVGHHAKMVNIGNETY